MKRKFLVLAAMAIAAMPLTCANCHAGVMNLAGTTKADSSAPYNGKAWSLALVYTPNLASAAATITAATLTIDSISFLLDTGGVADTVVVTPDAGLNDDRLFINADFLPSGSLGTNVAVLINLVVLGTVDVSPAIASDANIGALSLAGNAVTSGSFVLNPSVPGPPPSGLAVINFTGSVQAPEPGSFALLAGLGLVAGRRFLKRRKLQV